MSQMTRGLSLPTDFSSRWRCLPLALTALFLTPSTPGWCESPLRQPKNASTQWPSALRRVEVKDIASTHTSSVWLTFRQLARVCFPAVSTFRPTSTSSPHRS